MKEEEREGRKGSRRRGRRRKDPIVLCPGGEVAP